MSSNGSETLNFWFHLATNQSIFSSMQPCFHPQSLPDDEGQIALVALVACTGQLVCRPLPVSHFMDFSTIFIVKNIFN